MKTILASIDFSSSTSSTITEAVALARAFDGRLILLHVIARLPDSSSEFDFTEAAARMRSTTISETARELARLQQQLSKQRITALTHYVVGDPASAIIEQAHTFGADYVVVGTRGHGPLYELIVGGTAQRVIRECACPVLVAHDNTLAPQSHRFAPSKKNAAETAHRLSNFEFTQPNPRKEYHASSH